MNADAQPMPASERGQRGVARVLAKLDNSLQTGNYYEAHQMYRTLYFRFTAQNKYNECLELLHMGALKLAAKQQDTSAADLGILLLNTLEKRGNDDDSYELWLDRLGSIIRRISPSTVERETLITRTIKWSSDLSGYARGDPKIHKMIAKTYWAEGNIEQARYHFLICRDGNLCGSFLIEIHLRRGYPSEVDLFIVQAVLQQLLYTNPHMAESTFKSYTQNHPQVRPRGKGFELPLLNFTKFLLRTIILNLPDFFRHLCAIYKPSLQRDVSFEEYLSKIGVLYFNEQPPPKKTAGGGLMSGMFGDLFSKLMHDSDDDDDAQHECEHITTKDSAANKSNVVSSDLD